MADTADHQQEADALREELWSELAWILRLERVGRAQRRAQAGRTLGEPSSATGFDSRVAGISSGNNGCVSSQKRWYRVRRLHLPEG